MTGDQQDSGWVEIPVDDRRTHKLARVEERREWAGFELWFEDGMGLLVSYWAWERALKASDLGDHPIRLLGCAVHLELRAGRWSPARVELPK